MLFARVDAGLSWDGCIGVNPYFETALLGTLPKRLLREQAARFQPLNIFVRNAAALDGFAIDLLNWFIASDKAVTQPLKFGGGDTTVIVDALPICFYCFLNIESKRDSF